jgi:TIR domain
MSEAYRYDAFISYRRQEPDKAFARQLLKDLEAAGYCIAFDERDFPANASFLQEMERCVKESRFTLAVISPQYFESGNCEEESIICKVLDMGERKRRLVPLTIEKVQMPTWMYGIVGINYTDPDPLVPPLDKLKATLGNPQ